MLDFSAKSSSEIISMKTYSNPTSPNRDEDLSCSTEKINSFLRKPDLPKQNQKHYTLINKDSVSASSLISSALLAARTRSIQPIDYPAPNTSSPPSLIPHSTMNENVFSSSFSTTKIMGMAMGSSKVLPASSAPSPLKIIPKKFSPFSVDSLLSHKEKQTAKEESSSDDEVSRKYSECKGAGNKKRSKDKHEENESTSSTSSTLIPNRIGEITSQPLNHHPMGLDHHLSIAKFLLNNNLHERNNSVGLSSVSTRGDDASDSKDKFSANTKLMNYHDRDDGLQKYKKKKEPSNMDNDNESTSNGNDIDVCGDIQEDDMDDEDDEYHESINDLKSESNYQQMMSDEETLAEDDVENEEYVKTEDIDEEKLEFERRFLLSQQGIHGALVGRNSPITSASGFSPKQGPILHPRFPLGFPITSASPNPFSPTSPSSGVGGSTLPRPTPSFPWLPQLRSPLQLPGFIGSK